MTTDRSHQNRRALPLILRRRRRRLARARLLRRLRFLRRPFLGRNRQDQLRVVIGDVVDPRRNLVPGELAFFGRGQQRHHALGAVIAAVEPTLEIAGMDGHGHAVVQHAEIGAGRRGDDRHGVELLAVRTDPGFRQPRQADRLPVAAMDEVRPLGFCRTLPFIIAVRRNQAAPPPDRVLEGGFFRCGFRARIDQQAEFPGVLDPGRQQAPAHQPEMPDTVFDDHDRYRLCRRNIMSWREIGLLEVAENLPQDRRGRGYGEASAHSVA